MICTEVNVHREVYGKNEYWCYGVKGWRILNINHLFIQHDYH